MNKTTRVTRVVFMALLLLFLGASAVLLRFDYCGSFTLILSVQSPVNAESIIGITFLLLVFMRHLIRKDPFRI